MVPALQGGKEGCVFFMEGNRKGRWGVSHRVLKVETERFAVASLPSRSTLRAVTELSWCSRGGTGPLFLSSHGRRGLP